MIRAFMSKLREADLKKARGLRLGVNASFDYSSRWSPQEVLLQIGLFPFLPIGTVWRNGKYVFSLRADLERLSLNILPGDPEFHRASSREATGLVDEKGNREYRYLIPGRDKGYQVPTGGLEAQCFVLRLPATPTASYPTTVVIPCTELIRFYYCNSSALTYALFNGELEHYRNPPGDNGVFSRERSVLTGPTRHVQLRSAMRDEDAEVIARLAYDPAAYEGAAMIFSGLAKGKLDRQAQGATFPVSRPPFIGDTELTFRGKTIIQNGMKTILVLQIESCTGEVPWTESPTFRRDNDGRSDGTYDETRPIYNEGGKRVIPMESDQLENGHSEPRTPKKFGVQGAEPGVLITSFTLNENRFLATADRKPRKASPEPPTYRADPNRRTEFLVDSPGHSVNPSPEAGTQLAKASLFFEDRDPDADAPRAPREFKTPPTAKAFQNLMEALGNRDEIRSCESLVIADHGGLVPGDGLSSFCPLKAAEDLRGTVKPGTVRKRAYLVPSTLNAPGQRRVAWVAEVNLADGGWFYLFDAEQREAVEGKNSESFSLTCVFKEGMPKMGEAELFLVLQRWVAYHFVFPYEAGKPWRRVRIPHHFGGEKLRAAKILDEIRTEGTTKRERRKPAS